MEKEIFVQINLNDLYDLKQKADLYNFILKEKDEWKTKYFELKNQEIERDNKNEKM